jgi:hypothetical protein
MGSSALGPQFMPIGEVVLARQPAKLMRKENIQTNLNACFIALLLKYKDILSQEFLALTTQQSQHH